MEVSYENSFFISESVNKWAHYFNRFIPNGIDGIISRGSSGCSIATAILTVSTNPELRHFYFRKDGEDSHGGSHTAYLYKREGEDKKVVIVDDFIQTGSTLDHLLRHAEESKMIVVAIIVGRHNGNETATEYRGIKLIQVEREIRNEQSWDRITVASMLKDCKLPEDEQLFILED